MEDKEEDEDTEVEIVVPKPAMPHVGLLKKDPHPHVQCVAEEQQGVHWDAGPHL